VPPTRATPPCSIFCPFFNVKGKKMKNPWLQNKLIKQDVETINQVNLPISTVTPGIITTKPVLNFKHHLATYNWPLAECKRRLGVSVGICSPQVFYANQDKCNGILACLPSGNLVVWCK
jgi:hypothetical protein